MKSKIVKLYGVERSGTNLIQSLLELNTDAVVLTNKIGWKHGEIVNNGDHEFEAVNALVISKNPYHWYRSIMRFGKGINNIDPDYWYQKYNRLYGNYIDFEPDFFFIKKHIIKYENLLADQETIVAQICKKFGLIKKIDFINPDKVYMSNKFTEEKREKYLSDNYDLDNELIELINMTVSERVFNGLTYKKLWK